MPSCPPVQSARGAPLVKRRTRRSAPARPAGPSASPAPLNFRGALRGHFPAEVAVEETAGGLRPGRRLPPIQFSGQMNCGRFYNGTSQDGPHSCQNRWTPSGHQSCCAAIINHLARRKLLKYIEKLERAKGFEPSTPTLARLCSTPELRPLERPKPAASWQ
jgi:hypothetical protein